MSRFEIRGVTDKMYDAWTQRRKAVEFEMNLLFEMQRHRDEMAYKYAALAASGSRGGGGGGGGRSRPQPSQAASRRREEPSSSGGGVFMPRSEPAWELVSAVYGPEGVSYNNMQNTSTRQIAQVSMASGAGTTTGGMKK